ncbi:Vacuolar protein sorting-associated protein 41 [Tilletia horrida]|uniref:Vacuolar protein sorting-associated protein 41 n=1 Tax=Tilletia horrida TaxID=155126 RepID=A0AAN6GJW3_9BASI|nr:Vacuolar protein sorting-associated protein 41 [Tilletia horrida]KAK0543997.1 Vacuolar protein sorting-associated protein 41 [Tilletia horrida]KAK0560243.1 Vacuolar protein sorting-associated protein 41 [Tilletia horrida]
MSQADEEQTQRPAAVEERVAAGTSGEQPPSAVALPEPVEPDADAGSDDEGDQHLTTHEQHGHERNDKQTPDEADAEIDADDDDDSYERQPSLTASSTGSAQALTEDDFEDEDMDDDEEELEPSLKYERLKGGAEDILQKDTASAFAASDRVLTMGTHSGMIYVLDVQGNLVKGFRSHSASILDIDVDSTNEFVASAGMDGIVSISALSTSEQYLFDFKRPMRTVSLEPGFGKRSTRAFVCGGMAGALILREKSWFGHRETVLHAGEGPIWTARWRANFIAWANDRGVRVYNTSTQSRITFIPVPSADIRADLYRCTLFWQDDHTLIIGWGDVIKVVRIKERRTRQPSAGASTGSPAAGSSGSGDGKVQVYAEISSILQLDCMISGLAPYGLDILTMAYIVEEENGSDADEAVESDEEDSLARRSSRPARSLKGATGRFPGGRPEALPPELRIINSDGEELSSDVLTLQNYSRFKCNDYVLVPSTDSLAAAAEARALGPEKALEKAKTHAANAALSTSDEGSPAYFYIVSPHEIIVARPRDARDQIEWLLARQRFAEALARIEYLGKGTASALGFDATAIGRSYLDWLVEAHHFDKAAKVASKILGHNAKAWEDWIFLFVERGKLASVIPYIPIEDPTLSVLVYDMVLAHWLANDLHELRRTIREWPPQIYSMQAVVLAIEDRLQRAPSLKKAQTGVAVTPEDADSTILLESLAEIYMANHLPGKALPYYLRLRRPTVFDLIRDHNLFMSIQDQVLQLIEFEDELRKRDGQGGITNDAALKRSSILTKPSKHGTAIDLLVEHTHSIPVQRVVSQLEGNPRFLYMYLDTLFDKDPQAVVPFSDVQIELYADFEYPRLMSYLRAMSSYYSFEKAYKICSEREYVPEMVFLLGRIGDNKKALSLIIEKLGDVERAIDFAKEQNDAELWDDLLTYSDNKPTFIRGLLENVGAEIDPIRLVKRIRNGLEIPGLRGALIKILQDFNLQVSLLEGCCAILHHDGEELSQVLHRNMRGGQYLSFSSSCESCGKPLFNDPNSSTSVIEASTSMVVFLCRHIFHLSCLVPADKLLSNNNKSSGTKTGNTTLATPGLDRLLLEPDLLPITQTGSRIDGFASPERRALRARDQSEQKLIGEARMRVLLRRGCPTCGMGAAGEGGATVQPVHRQGTTPIGGIGVPGPTRIGLKVPVGKMTA